jgi:hypothetical protein
MPLKKRMRSGSASSKSSLSSSSSDDDSDSSDSSNGSSILSRSSDFKKNKKTAGSILSKSSNSSNSENSGDSSDDEKLEEHDSSLDKSLKNADTLIEEEEPAEKSLKLIPSEMLTYIEMLRGPPDGSENKIGNNTLRKIVGAMAAWWSASPPDKNFIDHATTRWGTCFDGKTVEEKFKSGILTSADLRYVYNKEMFKRIRIDAMLRQRGFLESAGDPNSAGEDISGVGYAQDLGKIQECISRGYQLLLSELYFRKALDKTVDQGCPALADPFGYVPYTEGKLNDYQTFIIFLLRNLHDNSYRRYNDCVYEQIVSPLVIGNNGKMGNFFTHAWKKVKEIKEFVISSTPKEDCFAQWQTMTTSNAIERASNYLQICNDPEFTSLLPNRLWHSFNNGIYFVEKQIFFKHGDPRIPSDIVCCKYHDQMFDESILKEQWLDVKVKYLDEVISYQFPITPHSSKSGKCAKNKCDHLIPNENEQKRIIGWIYAFIGRLLYEVGQKDKWQVMPFIVGRAGTGKSLLLKCIAHFFNTEDVEILANNSQRGFGLETLVNKLLWMCYEVKNDFTLDQGQMQSMISGEDVSVMRKNKTALNVLWKSPGILAGNEVANWVDNSGSMSRRIVVANWELKVEAENVDPYLDQKIKANIDTLLHKSSCAYAAVCSEFSEKDLWGKYIVKDENGDPKLDSNGNFIRDFVLPRYFHVQKERLKVASDPIMSFLKSESAVIVDRNMRGMPWERFRTAANNYFQRENIKNFSWKDTKYKSIFVDLGIKKFKLDNAFMEKYGGIGGNFIDHDGTSYALGTDWLSGVQEKESVPSAPSSNSGSKMNIVGGPGIGVEEGDLDL